MKTINVDGLFESFMRKYIKDHRELSADEMEDKVPELYAAFGKRPLEELGGKCPAEYYSLMPPKELCDLFVQHINEEVPVSDYMINALVDGDTEDELYGMIENEEDEELISYAVNILRDKGSRKPLKRYLECVTSPETDDNMRELMGEVIIEFAADIADDLVAAAYPQAGEEYVVEALAACPQRDDIFEILSDKFKHTKKLSEFAHHFAHYGDVRAIDLMKQRIKEDIKYSDYCELKYAIEALGGEYEDDRDFLYDPTYRKIKKGN